MPDHALTTTKLYARLRMSRTLLPAFLATAIIGFAILLFTERPAVDNAPPARANSSSSSEQQTKATLATHPAYPFKLNARNAAEQTILPARSTDSAQLPVRLQAEAARSMQLETWIRQQLAGPDPAARLEAVLRIYELDFEVATVLLQQVLISEKDGEVHSEAEYALENIAGTNAVDVITTGLDANDVADRIEAIDAFGRIGEPAVHLLGQVLFGDPDPDLRLRALKLLARTTSPAAAAILRGASRSGDTEAARAARDAIVLRGQVQTSSPLESQPYTLALEGADRDGEAADVFRELAELDEPEARIETIGRLYVLNDQDAVRILETVLQRDEDAGVRNEAVSTLAQIPSDAAATAIAIGLGDTSLEVRHQAVEALWLSDAPNILPLLGQVLHSDPNPELRRAAVQMLAEDDGAAAQVLIGIARLDPDPEVRALAANLIAR